MTDPRIEKMAKVLVSYSASVKPGDLVSIASKEGMGRPLTGDVQRARMKTFASARSR